MIINTHALDDSWLCLPACVSRDACSLACARLLHTLSRRADQCYCQYACIGIAVPFSAWSLHVYSNVDLILDARIPG